MLTLSAYYHSAMAFTHTLSRWRRSAHARVFAVYRRRIQRSSNATVLIQSVYRSVCGVVFVWSFFAIPKLDTQSKLRSTSSSIARCQHDLICGRIAPRPSILSGDVWQKARSRSPLEPRRSLNSLQWLQCRSAGIMPGWTDRCRYRRQFGRNFVPSNLSFHIISSHFAKPLLKKNTQTASSINTIFSVSSNF